MIYRILPARPCKGQIVCFGAASRFATVSHAGKRIGQQHKD